MQRADASSCADQVVAGTLGLRAPIVCRPRPSDGLPHRLFAALQLTFFKAATIGEAIMAEGFSISAEKTDVESRERNREFVVLLHGGFLLIGVVVTLLGPILPMLATKWSLDDAELGLLFTAQFRGSIIGCAFFAAIRLSRMIPARPTEVHASSESPAPWSK